MRELTFAAVYHPEWIEGWQLVDHPTVRPIQNGAPDLGWEGDPRLAVYLHNESKTFVLWRLEHDGEYRPVARLPEGVEITPGGVNNLIRNLIRIDSRRGFDAGQEVQDAEDAAAEVEAAAHREAVTEFADKLQFGLAHSHLPGVDVTRPRQVLSRR